MALQRQNEEEERFESLLQSKERSVIEIRSLGQLDTVVDAFTNAIIVVYLYSRSCGSCKQVLKHFTALCSEFERENARVVFVKHDVHDDFDFLTDVTRMYDIHSVPSFLFLSGGALIEKVQFRDSRHSTSNLPRQLLKDRAHLSEVIRRILFKVAPSAMP